MRKSAKAKEREHEEENNDDITGGGDDVFGRKDDCRGNPCKDAGRRAV